MRILLLIIAISLTGCISSTKYVEKFGHARVITGKDINQLPAEMTFGELSKRFGAPAGGGDPFFVYPAHEKNWFYAIIFDGRKFHAHDIDSTPIRAICLFANEATIVWGDKSLEPYVKSVFGNTNEK